MEKQAEFGLGTGVLSAIVPRNGTLIRLSPGKAKIIEYVDVGRNALDGQFVISAENEAIVTRRRILYNGALVISLLVDDKGDFIAPPQITNLGNPEMGPESGSDFFGDCIMEAIFAAAKKLSQKLSQKQRMDHKILADAVRVAARKAARNYTLKETGPVTVVNVTEIKENY